MHVTYMGGSVVCTYMGGSVVCTYMGGSVVCTYMGWSVHMHERVDVGCVFGCVEGKCI